LLERDGYPAGVPCWVDTGQPDPEAAVRFYGDLFGWEFLNRMPADANGQYFIAQLRGRDVAAVGSQPEHAPPIPAWNTYVWVDSADDIAAKVRDAGGTVLMEPFDVLDAGRMAVCSDPSGAGFSVWQANKHRGAQLVNEPGTWNWSNLNTRDIEGSTAFYGAVFGWETAPLELGEFQGLMLRVPGYADFLELNDPGLRRRHADLGAPEGFSDAIGWMNPMTSDQFPDDVPPHWSITFAVDDTDAIVGRTAELGGKVVTPPFDTDIARVGVIRTAVLSDPQGAAFSVNSFGPSRDDA
jgi:predicted enzyme related to lactoylglutathione lyase